MESFTGLLGCWLGCAHKQGPDAEMDLNMLFCLCLSLPLIYAHPCHFPHFLFCPFGCPPLCVYTKSHPILHSPPSPQFFVIAPIFHWFPGAVRASSIFPILSVILLFMGGLCIAASEFYKSRHNIILSAGIFFVSAGQSNTRKMKQKLENLSNHLH